MIVDDNETNRRILLHQTASWGMIGTEADSGTKALELLHQAAMNEPFQVAILDLMMPEMDGFEATAEIRRQEGDLNHTIIIAMTAHAMEGEREKCLAVGMDDYISKPVKTDALRLMLEKWIAPSTNQAEF